MNLIRILALTTALASPGLADGLAGRIPPVSWFLEARANAAAGRYFASDLTVHPGRGAALARSFRPVDAGSNVRAAARGLLNPLALIGDAVFPLAIEVQRQLAEGRGLDLTALVSNVEPGRYAGAVAGGFAGGLAGGMAGAAVQSALAGLGPVGAVAGLLARPVLGFLGGVSGMELGRALGGRASLREAVATMLESLHPLRDTGQALGGTIGAIVGQVLIPVPVIGGFIGGTIGGIVGAAIGNALARAPGLRRLDAWLRDVLSGWAGRLRGAPAAPAPPAPAPPAALAARSVPSFTDLPLLGR